MEEVASNVEPGTPGHDAGGSAAGGRVLPEAGQFGSGRGEREQRLLETGSREAGSAGESLRDRAINFLLELCQPGERILLEYVLADLAGKPQDDLDAQARAGLALSLTTTIGIINTLVEKVQGQQDSAPSEELDEHRRMIEFKDRRLEELESKLAAKDDKLVEAETALDSVHKRIATLADSLGIPTGCDDLATLIQALEEGVRELQESHRASLSSIVNLTFEPLRQKTETERLEEASQQTQLPRTATQMNVVTDEQLRAAVDPEDEAEAEWQTRIPGTNPAEPSEEIPAVRPSGIEDGYHERRVAKVLELHKSGKTPSQIQPYVRGWKNSDIIQVLKAEGLEPNAAKPSPSSDIGDEPLKPLAMTTEVSEPLLEPMALGIHSDDRKDNAIADRIREMIGEVDPVSGAPDVLTLFARIVDQDLPRYDWIEMARKCGILTADRANACLILERHVRNFKRLTALSDQQAYKQELLKALKGGGK